MAWTRQEERAFFKLVLETVNKFDLMGLEPGSPDGAPPDEYTTQARAIESVLVNRGQIAFADLSIIWLTWFGDDLKGREEAVQPFLDTLNALDRQNPS